MDSSRTEASPAGPVVSTAQLTAALVAGWLIPGAGHFILGKRARAGVFFAVILTDHSVVLRLRAQSLAQKGPLPGGPAAVAESPGRQRTITPELHCSRRNARSSLRRYQEALAPLERAKQLDPTLTEAGSTT